MCQALGIMVAVQFGSPASELGATINVWIHEIVKFVYMKHVLGPRNYGGGPVQRQERPFLSLRG